MAGNEVHTRTWAHSYVRVEDLVTCFGFCPAHTHTPPPLAELPQPHLPFTFDWGQGGEGTEARHFGSPVLCGNFMPFAPCNFHRHEFVLFIPALG